jgi:hypothetical protein
MMHEPGLGGLPVTLPSLPLARSARVVVTGRTNVFDDILRVHTPVSSIIIVRI